MEKSLWIVNVLHPVVTMEGLLSFVNISNNGLFNSVEILNNTAGPLYTNYLVYESLNYRLHLLYGS